ncbi:MAG TPA: hypothetical protein VJ225_06300 [Nitrososphaeraceae archaeon]|nr:hypothetical protein [Nitrososphaeraceae archaeon]
MSDITCALRSSETVLANPKKKVVTCSSPLAALVTRAAAAAAAKFILWILHNLRFSV